MPRLARIAPQKDSAAQPNRGPWFADVPPTGAPTAHGTCAQSTAREKGLSALGDSIDKGVPGRGGSRGEETVAGEGRALVRSIPATCGTGASIPRQCAGTKPRGFSLSRLLLAVLSGPQSARQSPPHPGRYPAAHPGPSSLTIGGSVRRLPDRSSRASRVSCQPAVSRKLASGLRACCQHFAVGF